MHNHNNIILNNMALGIETDPSVEIYSEITMGNIDDSLAVVSDKTC